MPVLSVLRFRNVTFLAIVVLALTLTLNRGFLASDDYWILIDKVFPVQEKHFIELVESDDVRAHATVAPFWLVGHIPYWLGASHPYTQFSLTLVLLGLINFTVLFFSFQIFYQCGLISERKLENWNEDFRKFSLLFFVFHAIAMAAHSRLMFETFAAPWITLSIATLMRYSFQGRSKDAVIATLCMIPAFAVRPQAAIVAILIPWVCLSRKDYRSLIWSSFLGLSIFVGYGFLDQSIRGEFHHSLKAILLYNVEFGKIYGDRPILYYFPLALIASFLFLYPTKKTWHTFRQSWPVIKIPVLAIAFFLGAHTLFDNKYERYLIPILPTIIWVSSIAIWNHFCSFKTYRWQNIVFVALNIVPFLLGTFIPPQKSVLDLTMFLEEKPEIKNVISYKNGGEHFFIPRAFITRPDPKVLYVETRDELTPHLLDCGNLVVANENSKEEINDLPGWSLVKRFSVNWIDLLSYKLNPKNNIRRSPLYAFACK